MNKKNNFVVALTEQQMNDLSRLAFMLFELKQTTSPKKTKLVIEYLLTKTLPAVEKNYKENMK